MGLTVMVLLTLLLLWGVMYVIRMETHRQFGETNRDDSGDYYSNPQAEALSLSLYEQGLANTKAAQYSRAPLYDQDASVISEVAKKVFGQPDETS